MVRLIIVDDEQIVLDGIQFIINKHFDEIEVVDVAKTGREAIEKCLKHRPDIVLMDIQMPGINGIEAISTIKEQNKDIKFIIISAYEQFDYAKEAVKLAVKDYVLKPINKNRLIEIIGNVIDEVNYERIQLKKQIENKEKFRRIMPILEHGFMYSILLNNDFKDEINNYKELFDIKNDNGYIMVLEFGEGDKPSKLKNKIGTGIKGQKFYPKVRNTIKYKCKCVVGPIIINRISVLIYEENYENEYEQRIKALELAESILRKIESIIDSSVYIGIGGCYNIERIGDSYAEAISALNKICGEKILHIKDIEEEKGSANILSYMNIKDDENKIIQKIEEGRIEEAKNLTKNFLVKIEKKIGSNVIDTKNIILELMVLVNSSGYGIGIEEQSLNYLDEIRKTNNLYELQKWCIDRIAFITEQIKDKKEHHVSNVIYKAKEYIDNNFEKDISLKDVSKEVSISPQYFSKIFKEELGVNFIEYLTNTRIKKAKKMLEEGNKSVKEISFEIGYNDPNYFSRLFRRIVGVSPTEYK